MIWNELVNSGVRRRICGSSWALWSWRVASCELRLANFLRDWKVSCSRWLSYLLKLFLGLFPYVPLALLFHVWQDVHCITPNTLHTLVHQLAPPCKILCNLNGFCLQVLSYLLKLFLCISLFSLFASFHLFLSVFNHIFHETFRVSSVSAPENGWILMVLKQGAQTCFNTVLELKRQAWPW